MEDNPCCVSVLYLFTVSGADYSEPEDSVRFPGCEKEYCTDIKITDDNVLEPLETFTISLMRSSGIGNEIRLEPDTMEIVIIDDDGMFVVCFIYTRKLLCETVFSFLLLILMFPLQRP